MSMTGKATIQFLLRYGVSVCGIYKSAHLTGHIFGRLLPRWLPFHPLRWWIFPRSIYLPMSYLYGVRFKAAEDPLILALREVGTQLHVSLYWLSRIPCAKGTVYPRL